MAELPFPSSGGVFEAFLQRIRISPNVRVNIDWLVNCLGISQRTNAGRTLHWLEAAGIIAKDGRLTPRGRQLLRVPTDLEFRAAALQALETLIKPHRLRKIRSNGLSRSELRDELCTEFEVGTNLATKAMAGLRVLAEASGDSILTEALGQPTFGKHRPTKPQLNLAEAKRALLAKFQLFCGRTGGIDGWLHDDTPADTVECLMRIPLEPLSAAQLNQLLTFGHAAPLSAGFFQYYWLTKPAHTYDLTSVPGYSQEWEGSLAIFDLDQLRWGLYRIYVDSLLYFGDVRAAYQSLRALGFEQLSGFFSQQRFATESMISRGRPALPLRLIDEDKRYMVSEMACKSYDPAKEDGVGLEEVLLAAYRDHAKTNSKAVTVGELLGKESGYVRMNYEDLQKQFTLAADEMLDSRFRDESELAARLGTIKKQFFDVRKDAIANTKLYLSSVGELDVYVATSMRVREDFHNIVAFCSQVFSARELRKYNLRYFDPTLSAAENHEDKGLIECLMVKCAKVLIYIAGEGESFGKDAEAAMALSLGKPVIFFCTTASGRELFYKEVHPLSRLVNFQNGVAVGAMVTDSEADVVQVLHSLFTNSMQYSLELKRPGYLVLKEAITDSVVRLQTSDQMLRETFWNHYHATRDSNAKPREA